jgi:hypothetical protein
MEVYYPTPTPEKIDDESFEDLQKQLLHTNDKLRRAALLSRMEGKAEQLHELETVDRLLVDNSPIKTRVKNRLEVLMAKKGPEATEGKAA